ncbi:hypothetical protein LLEC1_02695 [Akanthomyces lecanii]|uniref:Major facilitator superfamily (MFS) profile domain-containing protein n=1 Tax=Cordyceps confragosa TaxID=2714763 RepID=A0A179I9S7_CORDF|nr:hypothetical protein LLEC1_02695 [Akanthomyces lecanii]
MSLLTEDVAKPEPACRKPLRSARPPVFATQMQEIIFVFSISMSQFITEFFVSAFTLILPTLIKELAIPQASSVWPASAFSLAIASTLLIFGRLGDMFGGYWIFLGGLAWLLLWSVLAGFSINPIMLNICRALQGLGAAAFLPTGVMLMGSIYEPGPRKNMAFAIYGTSAVFGFLGGIVVAGVVGQFLRWGFYFWIGGILTALTLIFSIFSVPASFRKPSTPGNVKMDYAGAAGIVLGLGLTIFAITQSAHASAGWKTPYIPATFTVGILCLIFTVYTGSRNESNALLPMGLFKIPSMTPMLGAIFLLYGTWGIYSVYGTLFFQNIMLASPLQVVAWYAPLGIAGLIFSILEGYILHLVPGRILLVVSGLGAVGSQLLLALTPLENASYWAWILPAMILSTIGIDVSTILMTVFITTALPPEQQGLAGGVMNSVLQLGVAFVLGVADIVQSATVAEEGLGESYKKTFWFGVGIASVSLGVMALWGRVPKATSREDENAKGEGEQC